jgi:hypothetical protein
VLFILQLVFIGSTDMPHISLVSNHWQNIWQTLKLVELVHIHVNQMSCSSNGVTE